MTTFDGLQFDLFAPAHGQVTPQEMPSQSGVPVNPMVFPADWSTAVTVATRWQTDVTRNSLGNREAAALMLRPTRTVSVGFKAPGKDESFSMLQSLQQHCFTEAVVPLFSDATSADAFTWLDSSTLEIEADFRFRRFFKGGRVAIFAIVHQGDDREDYTIFGTLRSISSSRAVIDVETPVPDTLAVHRDIHPSDQIAPCIDCEMAEGTEAKAHTDGVIEVSIEWSEVEGASTLPALWPAFDDENAWKVEGVAERIPFGIGKTLPLFPSTINWYDGVEIAVNNPVENVPMGRSRILSRSAPPFHTISATVTAATREEAWQMMRFFDSCQGRRGVFLVKHPVSSFTIVGRDSSYVEISSVSSKQMLANHVKYLYLEKSNGDKQVVQITSVTSFGSNYRLNWGGAVADSNLITEVRQAFVCSFDSDELEEEWVTSGVAQFRFSVSETPYHAAVEIPDDLFVFSTAPTDPIRSVPDISVFLKAGSECFDPNGQACTNWPGTFPVPHTVYDVSRAAYPVGVFRPYGQRVSGSTGAALVRPFTDAFFGSQPVFLHTGMRIFPSARGAQNPYESAWGPLGWTIFLVFVPQGGLGAGSSSRSLFQVTGSHLNLDVAVVGGGYANGAIHFGTPTPAAIPGLFPVSDLGSARVMAVRLDFVSGNIQAWLDGRAWITKTTISPSFNTAGSITEMVMGWAASSATAVTAAVIRSVFGASAAAMVTASCLQFRRALSQDEMRQIASALSSIYNAEQSQESIVIL